jgi:hypothetical protein
VGLEPLNEKQGESEAAGRIEINRVPAENAENRISQRRRTPLTLRIQLDFEGKKYRICEIMHRRKGPWQGK